MTSPSSRLLEELVELEKKALDWLPGYLVGRDGAVFGPKGELKQEIYDDYPAVRVVLASGKRCRKAIHRLVCEAFHGERPSLFHEVRHLDGSKDNNHADNLRWGTKSENALDRQRHGTERAPQNGRKSAAITASTMRQRFQSGEIAKRRGEQLPFAKLTEAKVLQIRALRAQGSKLQDLADEFGVDQSLISQIARRVIWTHI